MGVLGCQNTYDLNRCWTQN